MTPSFRVTTDEYQLLRRAAGSSGVPLTSWIREVVLRVAREELKLRKED